MTNRDQITRLLTAVLEFLRDNPEPGVDALRELSAAVSAILRDACGDSYPALPLTGPGIFYQGEKR